MSHCISIHGFNGMLLTAAMLVGTACRPSPTHTADPPRIFCLLDDALAMPVVRALDVAEHVASSQDPSGIDLRLLDVLHAVSQKVRVLGGMKAGCSAEASTPTGSSNCDSGDSTLIFRTREDVTALLEDVRRDAPEARPLAPEQPKVLQALLAAWKGRSTTESDTSIESPRGEEPEHGCIALLSVTTWTLASRACAACVEEIRAWVRTDSRFDYRTARRVDGVCHAAEVAARALAADARGLLGLAPPESSSAFSLDRWNGADGVSEPGAREAVASTATSYLGDLYAPFLVAASWLPLRYRAPTEISVFDRFCTESRHGRH